LNPKTRNCVRNARRIDASSSTTITVAGGVFDNQLYRLGERTSAIIRSHAIRVIDCDRILRLAVTARYCTKVQ
jgi:hypothetical protein